MVKGTIKNLVRSYGFIEQDSGEDDVFFLQSWVEDVPFSGLREGLRLEYQTKMTEKGLQAVEETIRVIEGQEEEEVYRFLNPYNFIRLLNKKRMTNNVLGDVPPPPHDRYLGLSGRITCAIENISPLFVSDSHAIDGKSSKHREFRFFKVQDEKGKLIEAVPASSIRGSLRNIFEAVTNSCFVIFDGDRKLEYRKEPSYALDLEPGIISSLPKGDSLGEVNICEFAKVGAYYWGAKSKRNVLDNGNWKPGDPVWARITKGRSPRAWQLARKRSEIENPSQKKQIVQGFLKITGKNIPTKRNEYLFYSQQGTIKFDDPVVKEYNAILSDQIEDKRIDIFQNRKLSPGDLVWVEVNGNHAVRISHVRIPRVQFDKPLNYFIAEHLRTCREYSSLCPACRTFGWVYPKKDDETDPDPEKITAYAGRVHLSHAELTHNAGYHDEITLAILSSPKPTTPQFYLLDKNGNPNPKVDYNTKNALLRGRKLYRHHSKTNSEEYTRAPTNDPRRDDQNRTIKGALKPGAKFTFTIDYENLDPIELGALLFALQLEEGLHHRLGYAKPLGFGSVKLSIGSVTRFDWRKRLNSPDSKAGHETIEKEKWQSWIDNFLKEMHDQYRNEYDEILDDLRALLGEPPDLPIHYPRTDEVPDPEGKNFEWFVGNKKVGETLPLATDEEYGLPLIDRDGRIR